MGRRSAHSIALPGRVDILRAMFRAMRLHFQPLASRAFMVVWSLLAGPGVISVLAQAAVEGTVPLPKDAPRATLNERYQVKAGQVAEAPGPVAVVYLEGSFPASSGTNSAVKAEMWQKDFQFLPAVLPVRKGTAVEFPNGDDGYHNVFSYSKTKRFDLGRYRKDEKPAVVTFDQPGAVKLYCEIHEHMRATILVLDTPHFVVTGEGGRFALTNLPPGQFTLKAWLDEKKILEKPVTLKDGETLKVDFTAP
jgi:plastocyanin